MPQFSAITALYRALASLCDEDGYVRDVSQRQLAAATGLDTTLIAAALRVMEHDDYVQRFREPGQRAITVYRIAPINRIAPEPVKPDLRVVRGGAAS
jgi:DNA-binding MarR family transcriptional regulator